MQEPSQTSPQTTDSTLNGHTSATAASQAEEALLAPAGMEKTEEYYREPRHDIRGLVSPRGKRILDVGCASGELGYAFKRAGAQEVIGIELHGESATLASQRLDQVYTGDIQTLEPPLEPARFDYIIFDDILEHTIDPWAIIASYRRFLKPDGRVILSIPNIRFYSVIGRLLLNRWEYQESGVLDRTHLRFFTWPNIQAMFEGAGYRIERVVHNYRLFEDQSQIGRIGAVSTRIFCRAFAPWPWRHFFTYQYLVVAKPGP